MTAFNAVDRQARQEGITHSSIKEVVLDKDLAHAVAGTSLVHL
jgi:hypothetical protein